jgi:hypothetical protein
MTYHSAMFKLAKSYVYLGYLRYLVAYDYASVRKNRYTVLALNVGDPVTIGRVLDLATVKALIADYEEAAIAMGGYMGSRLFVMECMDRVNRKRCAARQPAYVAPHSAKR